MSTRIGLMSDLHAAPEPVQEALSVFRAAGVSRIFCGGDIAGYGDRLDDTIAILRNSPCQSILGNHEVWYLEKHGPNADPPAEYFRNLPYVIDEIIAGKRIYLVHASPPQSIMDGIKLLDETGRIMPDQKIAWTERLYGFEPDVLIVGHTHQVFAEQLGQTLVINPGSTRFNHTCAILQLPEMKVEVIPLSGETPVLAWNWGMEAYNDSN
ncbi:MAG: metallophosphatase family protein [Proteobacteria bacterium]|jgi:predicted phosphodiesterase|nr:metallophosphatase family protein [Pseudomonadota bacterium]MCG6935972.1 metallophosphatase family protein [Pseudomonadota bacterium]